MAKTPIVEGWRFLPHSYAVVHQWQLLALKRRGDVDTNERRWDFYKGFAGAGFV